MQQFRITFHFLNKISFKFVYSFILNFNSKQYYKKQRLKKLSLKRKMSTMLYILVSILIMICAIFYFFTNRELFKRTNHFPGPFNLPLIGCAYKFIGDSTRKILIKLMYYRKIIICIIHLKKKSNLQVKFNNFY